MSEEKAILDKLAGDDMEVLREAAFAAGEMRLVAAVPRLAALLKTNHLGVQEAADSALRKIGGHETVQAVIPLLRSEEAPIRNLSMDILREVGVQDFASLGRLVHDQDPDIRIFASDILGMTKSPMAIDPLCEALLRDPEVNVRYQAAVSLGDLGLPEGAKCLNKAMEDEEWVQYAVIEALSKLKHASSVGALVKALDRSSDLVASMIIDALGETGNVKAVAMLLRRMNNSPTALRNKIVKAIIMILGGKSLNLLSKNERENFQEYMLVALDDEDREVQDAAVLGLGHMGGEEASEKILSMASRLDPDRDQDRLQAMLEALARIGLTASLKAGLSSEDPARARVVVEALSRMSDPEAPRALMDAFWAKDRDVQRDIVLCLLNVADPTAKDFFLDILDRHKDGTVLKGALRFLGMNFTEEEVGEKLFTLLAHPWDDVKETALEACINIGGPTMNARFTDLYYNADPVNRLMAIYALGRLGVGENLDFIRQGLEDEVPDIRKVAIEAVGSVCTEQDEWLPMIVGKLSDENRDVRLTVIEMMGKCYNPEVIPHLLHALDDDDDWVRIRAVEALAAHGEAEAVPKLVGMLDSPNKLVAIKVVQALGDIGGTAAFRSLLEVTDSMEDEEIRAAAEEAIAKIQAEQGEEG